MSPAVERGKTISWQERSVLRRGITPPQVGDIIERDREQVRVLRSRVRLPTPLDEEAIGADPFYGDLVLELEYEPTSPPPASSSRKP